MANAFFHGKRVSPSHKVLLDEAERRGILDHINQGRRTIAEQTAFWNAYQAFLKGGPWAPRAAFPVPSAPHIKWGKENHANDIDDGVVDRVAEMYREMGVPVAFNVAGEPWHMDTLSEDALIRAAGKLKAEGGLLATLKPGMTHNDVKVAKKHLARIGRLPKSRLTGSTYGPYMLQAVKTFQKNNGLTPDGVIGPTTWKKLINKPTPKPKDPKAKTFKPSSMKISTQGVLDIMRREGVRLKAYKPVPTEEFWTIGVGHYGPDVTEGMVITKAQAEALLRQDLKVAEEAVRKLPMKLTQRQYDALVSAVFNLGPGVLEKGRSLGDALRAKDPKKVAAALKLYNKGGNPLRVLEGLVKRREEEAAPFLV